MGNDNKEQRVFISKETWEVLDEVCSLGDREFNNEVNFYVEKGEMVEMMRSQKKRECLSRFWHKINEIKERRGWY